MTHRERLGSKRTRPACPVTLLGGAALGALIARALAQLGLENPLNRADPDPEAATPGRPCLIVLDLADDPARGLAVLQARRARGERRSVPVLVLGPPGEPWIVAQAYGAGAHSYLVRPGAEPETFELLKVALEYWLRISRVPV